MSDITPNRGEIWLADLSPVRGHEQSGRRPCLVISVDYFNQSPADLVIIVPVTTREKGIRSPCPLEPGSLPGRSSGSSTVFHPLSPVL